MFCSVMMFMDCNHEKVTDTDDQLLCALSQRLRARGAQSALVRAKPGCSDQLWLKAFDDIFFHLVSDDVVDEILGIAGIGDAVPSTSKLHKAVALLDVNDFTIPMNVSDTGNNDKELRSILVCVDGAGLGARRETRQFDVEGVGILFGAAEGDRNVAPEAAVVAGFPGPLLEFFIERFGIHNPVWHKNSSDQ